MGSLGQAGAGGLGEMGVQADVSLGRLVGRAFRLSLVMIVMQATALFVGAHALAWPRGWLVVGLLVLTMLVNVGVMARYNPRALRERFRRHKDTKSFDTVITRLYLVALLVMMYVAGRDAMRAGWWPIGEGGILPGVLLYIIGNAIVAWTMVENRHLETTVRIQEGHEVVTTGPYRIVRHPMYVGSLMMTAGCPLVAGSVWAYVPFGAIVGLFVLRTALEDRTLHEELAGYAEYAKRTRYRLLPGLW